jgi:uncharacterized protein
MKITGPGLLFFLALNILAVRALAQGTAYEESIRQWDRKRVEDLKAENGWLNLAGLFWLKPGKASFGSGQKADVRFPAGTIQEHAGYFEVTGQSVSITTDKNALITVNGRPIQQALIYHKDSSSAPELQSGSLKWNIIRRDDKLAIRLRNLQSDAIKNFKGIERFAVDSNWRIRAVLQPGINKGGINIINVLGQSSTQSSPGKLHFSINGKQYTLDALDGGKDELFLIFGDETNGVETYPSGRYMYIPRPGNDGVTYIDFNKAYNPPCAFTDYATCPLPPKQNILPIAIPAGEKKYTIHDQVGGGH